MARAIVRLILLGIIAVLFVVPSGVKGSGGDSATSATASGGEPSNLGGGVLYAVRLPDGTTVVNADEWVYASSRPAERWHAVRFNLKKSGLENWGPGLFRSVGGTPDRMFFIYEHNEPILFRRDATGLLTRIGPFESRKCSFVNGDRGISLDSEPGSKKLAMTVDGARTWATSRLAISEPRASVLNGRTYTLEEGIMDLAWVDDDRVAFVGNRGTVALYTVGSDKSLKVVWKAQNPDEGAMWVASDGAGVWALLDTLPRPGQPATATATTNTSAPARLRRLVRYEVKDGTATAREVPNTLSRLEVSGGQAYLWDEDTVTAYRFADGSLKEIATGLAPGFTGPSRGGFSDETGFHPHPPFRGNVDRIRVVIPTSRHTVVILSYSGKVLSWDIDTNEIAPLHVDIDKSGKLLSLQ